MLPTLWLPLFWTIALVLLDIFSWKILTSPVIFLAALWTFFSSVKACVLDNLRYPVWLVYCSEEGEKMHSVSTGWGLERTGDVLKSLLFLFLLWNKSLSDQRVPKLIYKVTASWLQRITYCWFQHQSVVLFCRHDSHLSFGLIPMDRSQL